MGVAGLRTHTELMQSRAGAVPVRQLDTFVLSVALTLSASLRSLLGVRALAGVPTTAVAARAFAATRAPAAPGTVPPSSERIDPDVVEHVRGAQEGNAYSFAVLYDRYVDQVYAYVYHRVGHRQTAEDLTSDVFVRALKRIDSFSWQGKDFGAWLTTIARNRCHDHFKSARFRLEATVDEVFDTPATTSPDLPEAQVLTAELQSEVHAALAKLKSDQAEVLYLRFLQGHDVGTTAQIMGKNEQSIRALQYRALKSLAKHVDAEKLVAA